MSTSIDSQHQLRKVSTLSPANEMKTSQHIVVSSLLAMAAIGVSGQTYTASFTLYGSRLGSPNCNSARNTACGFYTYPGYSAAVSQNLYGLGPGQGASGACATCYYATADRQVDGTPFENGENNWILLMVDNLCPTSSPHCSQEANGLNDWGQDVNFDLCDDSGAGAALLTKYGVEAGLGWVTVADCTAWFNQGGQMKYDVGSG